jgi:glucose/arabinose dehydrogenase
MRRRSPWPAAALIVASVATLNATNHTVSAATPPVGFTDTSIATFDRATAVEWLPNDQIAVLEQKTGRIRVARPGEPFTTVLDLAVCDNSERGLLGLTADPAFLGNGWLYVYYTAAVGGGCVNRVSRFTFGAGRIDPATETILLDNIASTGGNHNGGDLDIDGEGNLLVSIGDSGSDPRGNSGSAGSNDAAQDLSLLNGKIVRITRDGRPAPGNPFTGPGTSSCARSGTSAPSSTKCQEIFAWGLRNPYRIAVDRNDGAGRFFINDVGQGTSEEVDVGRVGANYGWPGREGSCPQGRTSNCSGPPAGVTDPITSYGRNLGTYITAGAFVPDGLWPAEFDGAYLFADGGFGSIWLRRADGSIDYGAPFATGAFGITDMTFGFDTDGVMALYYVQVGGGLRMIKPASTPAAPTGSNLKLMPIESFRAYDTGADDPVPAGQVFNGTTRLVDLDPPAGTRAALVNLTYDATAGPGFVRTWAARTRRPATSSLNADRANTIAANAAVVALAPDGSFVLESATTGRVIVDVMGWFGETSGTSDDGRFVALDPARIADTRISAGTILDSGSPNPYSRTPDRIDVDILGRLAVPDDDTVAAVVIAVATIGKAGTAGFIGGHAGGTPWPGTSNVNVSAREVRANMMVIPIGGNGGISLTTVGVADVAVDVLGYVTSASATASRSGLYNTIAPTRTVDTRIPLGSSTLRALGAVRVATPASTAGASAVAQNITVTNTTGPGWLAAHPGPVAPLVSNVNYDGPGHTRAAFAFTTVSASDTTSFTSLVATDLVVDVVGYFSD